MDTAGIEDLINHAEALTKAEASQLPGHSLYEFILTELRNVRATLPEGPRACFESARVLGMVAVRELTDANMSSTDLGEALIRLRDELRKLAGLPYHA